MWKLLIFPVLTNKILINDALGRTGDLAMADREGLPAYRWPIKRRDHPGWIKHSLGEIGVLIRSHLTVDEVVVLGVPNVVLNHFMSSCVIASRE